MTSFGNRFLKNQAELVARRWWNNIKKHKNNNNINTDDNDLCGSWNSFILAGEGF